MAMPNAVTEWTVDLVDALPDDGQRYEIIDGALFVTPPPSELHQVVAGHLYSLIKSYLKGSSVGRPMISPSDVRKEDRTRTRVQPDVFVLRLRDRGRPAYPYSLDDLLLAVEIVSPGNPHLDYQVKRELYLRNGVSEYWVINPDARNLSRWRNSTDPGEVLSERVEWHPTGMPAPFVIDLATFFDEAFD